MKVKDLVNKRFGRLTILECQEITSKNVIWKCRCDCGKITLVSQTGLLYDKTKSCGCIRKEMLSNRSNAHHHSQTRIYKIWIDIKKRCYNINSINYKNYGGRGITICDEWKNDFMPFYNWSMNNGYTDKLSIDRINNDGNYEPSNCRWVDKFTQANNTRRNHYITYKGKEMTLAEWSKTLNIGYDCLKTRLRRGWSIEEAFNTPTKK